MASWNRVKKRERSLAKVKPTNLQKLGTHLGKVNRMGVFDNVRSLPRHKPSKHLRDAKPTKLQDMGEHIGKINPMSISSFAKRKLKKTI
jgi:hypothetical protein